MSANNSSLQASKLLKSLSRYAESEILTGIASLAKKDQEEMKRISRKLVRELQDVDTTKVKSQQKKRKP